MADKRERWSTEKVATLRPRRRSLPMVLARDDRDGFRAVAVEKSRNNQL